MSYSLPTAHQQMMSTVLQDRYGMRLASRLSTGALDLPYDISERLRASRMQALSARKVAKTVPVSATSTQMNGNSLTMGFGDEGLTWWNRIASVLPLVFLIYGLVMVQSLQDEHRANEIAEVDAALLTDDLPPAAYADPAFLEFLKTGNDRPL